MIDGIGAGCDITVVLPHYECPSLLNRAIASVMAQTHARWSLVIVDDDSPCLDAVMDVRLRWIDDRVLWLRTSANVGPYRISNRLLPRIVSPFVAFQDADDWSVPERFERLLSAADKWRCDLVGSAITRARADSQVYIVRPPFDVNRALRSRHRGGALLGATMLCRTAFLRLLGGFDGTTRLGADTDFVHRAVFVGSIRNHPEPLYGCLERSESLTQSPSTGFDSDLRRAYQARLRRRFYANLLRHWTGTLAVRHLQALPNDVDFHLNYLENGQRAA
jgi:glycosyltransferase involved in cell wall biosynthesis